MNLFFAYLIILYKDLNYLPYFIINALDLNIQKTFTYITSCKRLALWSTRDQEGILGWFSKWGMKCGVPESHPGLTSLSEVWNWKEVTFSNYFSSFFSPFIFISWRLITLQYCSGFCHTLTWISHRFTYIPHPDHPSHLPLHPIHLGLPSAPARSAYPEHLQEIL